MCSIVMVFVLGVMKMEAAHVVLILEITIRVFLGPMSTIRKDGRQKKWRFMAEVGFLRENWSRVRSNRDYFLYFCATHYIVRYTQQIILNHPA